MPAAESQKSANVNAAVLLGMSDKIEALEKGKLADIIALDENPLQHIKTLQSVRFVIKDGTVFKHKRLFLA